MNQKKIQGDSYIEAIFPIENEKETVLLEESKLYKTFKIQIVKRNNSDKNFGNLYLQKKQNDTVKESFPLSNQTGKANEFFQFLISIVELCKEGKIEPKDNYNDSVTITLNLHNCEVVAINNQKIIEKSIIENSDFLKNANLLKALSKDKDCVKKFIETIDWNNEDYLNAFCDANPKTKDFIILEQRKRGLEEFKKLLDNPNTTERRFQKFFEENKWVFNIC